MNSRVYGEEEYDAIVLGAGISGLVSASVLAANGAKKILVLDEYDHVGGNHIDRRFGDYTFDIGCFVFHDTSPLLTYFPELLDRYTEFSPKVMRLNPIGEVTKYPISLKDDVFGRGWIHALRIFSSALYDRLFIFSVESAGTLVRKRIGTKLFHETGLASYMRRFSGIDAEQIDVEFAQKRMRWVTDRTSVLDGLKFLLRKIWRRAEVPSGEKQLVRPKEGFSHLYKAVANKLENLGVTLELGQKLETIDITNRGFGVVTKGGKKTSDVLVATIPIQKTAKLCGIDDYKKFRSNCLITLFFSFRGSRNFHSTILYNFSHEGTWKRLTVYSDMYGEAAGREYFAVEIVGDLSGAEPQAVASEFESHARKFGLFDGDLKLEGSNTLENAYPLYTKGSIRDAEELSRKLRNIGILSHGRQGAFNYQPTAKVSVTEAKNEVESFLGK